MTTNLVSHGPEETDQDMMLTYIFEWNFHDVQEGTKAFDDAVDGLSMVRPQDLNILVLDLTAAADGADGCQTIHHYRQNARSSQ